MKAAITLVAIALVACRQISATIEFVPKPFCLCGTVYKLEASPIGYQAPLLTVNKDVGQCGLTTVQLGKPACSLCNMQQRVWPTSYPSICPRPYPICRPPPPPPKCNCGFPCGCRL